MTYSKVKELAHRFGGKWKYDGCASWWCDDEKRHVSRCCSDFYNDGDDVGPPVYYLYEEGKDTFGVRFNPQNIKSGEGT